MPYKDKKRQSEYTLAWVHARRRRFFENKNCKRCRSRENLQLHHRDPQKKTSHRIFSWSKEKFEAEAAKCDVLCAVCHPIVDKERRAKDRGHGNLTAYRYGCRCEK